jgi:F-type H+-transporting ATPase subunit epsilon
VAGELDVSVMTAEGRLFEGPARFVVVPGADGELGVLPRHVPLVAVLKPGAVRIEPPGAEEEVLFVSGGFVEVGRKDQEGERTVVTVLADTGEHAHDIDEAQAEEARKRAQELLTRRLSTAEYAEAAALLERSTARIRVADVARRRRSRREPPVRG